MYSELKRRIQPSTTILIILNFEKCFSQDSFTFWWYSSYTYTRQDIKWQNFWPLSLRGSRPFGYARWPLFLFAARLLTGRRRRWLLVHRDAAQTQPASSSVTHPSVFCARSPWPEPAVAPSGWAVDTYRCLQSANIATSSTAADVDVIDLRHVLLFTCISSHGECSDGLFWLII